MARRELKFDPYENDPGHWGASLVNVGEVMVECLDAANAKSVVEVGAYAGDLTRLLLDWAAQAEATVSAVDPLPKPQLEELERQRDELELVREYSHEALKHIPLTDAIVLDGDHNHFTVAEELRLIGERAPGAELPLLLFHDVCWPHARRDTYYDPDQVPEDRRQPMVEGAGLYPGVKGTRLGGLPYKWAAQEEGGETNGVLTAVEQFVEESEGLRLAVVPAFFGFGVVWHEDREWASAVENVVGLLDRHPVLERLEANRVLHLASSHYHLTEVNELRRQKARQEEVLRRLLDSSAFAVAERLSRLRERVGIAKDQTLISKDEVRSVLVDDSPLNRD